MKSREPDLDLSKGSWRELEDYDDVSVFVVMRMTEPAPPIETFASSGARAPKSLPAAPRAESPSEARGTEDASPKKTAAAPDVSLPNSGVLPALLPAPSISRSSGIDAPPPIRPPNGIVEIEDRCWMPQETPPSIYLDCYSHRGPPWTWRDKDNEDFAFTCISAAADGDLWVLVGVCDGVSNSTWAERGAQLAALAFIEVVSEKLCEESPLEEEMQRATGKRAFASAFQRRTKELLETDARFLFERRYLHPSWRDDLYERTFLYGQNAAAKRAEWLQTTLLAAALGPRGGFALLLGDGFVRVDRHKHGQEVRRRVIPLHVDERAPERRISLSLTIDEVEQSLRGVLPEHCDRLAIVLATDGVSKSPDHGLEDHSFDGSRPCRSFLEDLASRAKGEVESDNMSVAFASRETP